VRIFRYSTGDVRRRKAFIKAAFWIPELNITAANVDKDPWLLTASGTAYQADKRE
jgi:hypothetical protein